MTTGTEEQSAARVFAYEAQTAAGDRLDGHIHAADADAARWKLQALGLRVLELNPADAPAPMRPLRGDAFEAFNQQLANLTAAGLPIEQGLRLIAQDMGSGKLAASVRAVAADLDAGVPIERAFENHAGRFPPLYGRLIEAGVRSGDLPGVLLNIGRHAEMTRRLRRTLWEAAAYPLTIVGAVVLLLLFVAVYMLPIYTDLFRELDVGMPRITLIVLDVGYWVAPVALVLGIVLALTPQIWWLLGRTGHARRLVDWAARRAPLVGPVLRRNVATRWCDAVHIGVRAGLDLPQAIRLAEDAIALPSLSADCDAMIAALEQGAGLRHTGTLRLLPPVIPVAMDVAAERGDLHVALAQMTQMYERQTEQRMDVLGVLLGPVLVVIVALLVGFVVFALIVPLIGVTDISVVQ